MRFAAARRRTTEACALVCVRSASAGAYAPRPPPGEPGQPAEEEPELDEPPPDGAPEDPAQVDPAEAAPEGEEGEEGVPFAPHPPLALIPPEELEAAGGQEEYVQQQPEVPSRTGVIVGGYMFGVGGYSYVPSAVPQFRSHFSPALSASGALILRGNPYKDFFYVAHLGFNAEVPLGFNVFVEEASVQWGESESFNVKGGHMRVPFSLAQPGVITAPLRRSAAGDRRLHPRRRRRHRRHPGDEGPARGRSGGRLQRREPRALLAAVHPRGAALPVLCVRAALGQVPYGEVDAAHGPLRLGFGMAGAWTAGRYFDSTGYNSVA